MFCILQRNIEAARQNEKEEKMTKLGWIFLILGIAAGLNADKIDQWARTSRSNKSFLIVIWIVLALFCFCLIADVVL